MSYVKTIPNTDGKYGVNKEGEVWRIKGQRNYLGQTPPHIVSPTDNGHGYQAVNLCGRINYVHRLTAQMFLYNPENYRYVGHKDHDKTNNHVDNLYWTDASTNTSHGVRDGKINYTGRYKDGFITHPDSTLEKAYVESKLTGNVTETAKKYGVNRTTLSSWLNKRSRVDLTDKLDKHLTT